MELTSGYVRKAPISTLPADTVRFGSICVSAAMGCSTHDHGEVRVVELLIVELCVHVDTREPASVSRVSG